VSASSFGLAFILGAKHGYLVYTSALSAVLLRNQAETLLQIGFWILERYEATKEFTLEYCAKKTGREFHRPREEPGKARQDRQERSQSVPPQQVAGALERVGAACLANCLVSGIGFGMASVGVLGDMA
jgi:hypothetical protein